MIAIENLTKIYKETKGVKALDNVSMFFPGNEICVILGHNGAGKTTLLSIINGIVKKTEGTINYWGNIYSEVPGHIISSFGYVTSELKLYARLTVREIINFLSKLVTPSSFYSVEELIEIFELKGYLDRYINTLSTGIYKRVQITCSLLTDIKYLFLDEPESGLDPISRIEIEHFILNAAGKDFGIVVSTHDLNFAEKIADRIILLKEGKLVFAGRKEEFVSMLQGRNEIKIKINSHASYEKILKNYKYDGKWYYVNNSIEEIKIFFDILNEAKINLENIEYNCVPIGDIYKHFYEK